ncbi:hypothetical protein QNO07_00050 [Streptomyces sp. 549]|uniref:hypothetical protein n=1 Tax=Streptomyces sp. 549 TaxID=3049076 RepID=UPI0024C39A1D|nr:hypothetical protein [Streptomyces sp. 549]MDK1471831.1 hypothetical protein [Streptomyces sp. 549]
MLVAAAVPLGSATGVPVAFAVAFGGFQVGGAGCLALIAGCPVIPPALARTVVAVNALCAVGCVVTAFTGFVPLDGFGVVFLLIGALIVAVYTALQYTGLRRMADSGDLARPTPRGGSTGRWTRSSCVKCPAQADR